MNVIEFRVVRGDHDRPQGAIAILIDGVPLESRAKVIEQQYADNEGNPDLAGDYAPLSLRELESAARHFLGEPQLQWFADGDTVLMGCPCDEWGCWPLTADVGLSQTTVTWKRFRNGHRSWDLTRLGPFKFDRAQYETALRTIDG